MLLKNLILLSSIQNGWKSLDGMKNWPDYVAVLIGIITIVLTIVIACKIPNKKKVTDLVEDKILKKCLIDKNEYFDVKSNEDSSNKNEISKGLPTLLSSKTDNNIHNIQGYFDSETTTNLTMYCEEGKMNFYNLKQYNNLVILTNKYIKEMFNELDRDKFSWLERIEIKGRLNKIQKQLLELRKKLEKVQRVKALYPTVGKRKKHFIPHYLVFFYTGLVNPDTFYKNSKENSDEESLYEKLALIMFTKFGHRNKHIVDDLIFQTFNIEMDAALQGKEGINDLVYLNKDLPTETSINDQEEGQSHISDGKKFVKRINDVVNNQSEDINLKEEKYSDMGDKRKRAFTNIVNHLFFERRYGKGVKVGDKGAFPDSSRKYLYAEKRKNEKSKKHSEYVYVLDEDANFSGMVTKIEKMSEIEKTKK